MALHLHLPRRRRGTCPASNPATLKADLDAVLAHNAELAVLLLEARRAADVAVGRAERAEEDLNEILAALGRDVEAARAVTA